MTHWSGLAGQEPLANHLFDAVGRDEALGLLVELPHRDRHAVDGWGAAWGLSGFARGGCTHGQVLSRRSSGKCRQRPWHQGASSRGKRRSVAASIAWNKLRTVKFSSAGRCGWSHRTSPARAPETAKVVTTTVGEAVPRELDKLAV
jgi:hypothetical protein